MDIKGPFSGYSALISRISHLKQGKMMMKRVLCASCSEEKNSKAFHLPGIILISFGNDRSIILWILLLVLHLDAHVACILVGLRAHSFARRNVIKIFMIWRVPFNATTVSSRLYIFWDNSWERLKKFIFFNLWKIHIFKLVNLEFYYSPEVSLPV